MKRLMEKMVFLGLVIAWRRATWPTRRSPSLVNATTDGVVRPPSALGMTTGSPPSITATTELVVPRSMPMTFAMPAPLSVWCGNAAGGECNRRTGENRRFHAKTAVFSSDSCRSGRAWQGPDGRAVGRGSRTPGRGHAARVERRSRTRHEARALNREIAPFEDGFIAAHQASFIIDQFDADGNPIRRFTRKHPDFITVPLSDSRYPYNSLILDVLVETPERVWLLYQTRHPDFERLSALAFMGGRETTVARSGRHSDLRNWVVELLDLTTGRVLARQKTEQNLAAFIEPGTAVGYGEREDGTGQLVLVKLHPELPRGGDNEWH